MSSMALLLAFFLGVAARAETGETGDTGGTDTADTGKTDTADTGGVDTDTGGAETGGDTADTGTWTDGLTASELAGEKGGPAAACGCASAKGAGAALSLLGTVGMFALARSRVLKNHPMDPSQCSRAATRDRECN